MLLQQRVFEEERAKQANVDAEMRRLEVENRTRNKEEANVSNLRVLEEQAEQERLERELRDIDIAIGTIYDEREGRKKLELRELEDLDNQSIDLKQQMRASKVKQKALEDSLADLSKIMTWFLPLNTLFINFINITYIDHFFSSILTRSFKFLV